MSSGDVKENTAPNKEASTLREIYDRFYGLLRKVESESPLLSNFGIGLSFSSKLRSLEIMQKYTIEKTEKLLNSYEKKRKEPVIFLKDTTKYLYEATAFFEAYFNAFYSLLQIIAKVTPCFYKDEIPNDYFGNQRTHFIQHNSIDVDYAEYLENHMIWYEQLICNRNATSHNVSSFIAFGEEEIEFIHMPKKRIDYFENGKPTKRLIGYISENWFSLFNFLDFYTKHFSTFQIFVNKEEEMKKVTELLRTNS